MKSSLEQIDVNMQELEKLLEQTRQGRLEEGDYQKLRAAIHTLGYVAELLRERNISLAELRELLLSPSPASTEKTSEVLKGAGLEPGKQNSERSSPSNGKPARPGHGRNGASAYGGATKVRIAHPALHSGDRCPGCCKSKVYVLETPGVLIRLVGQAPIAGTIYELEKLRCNLCLEVFTAEAPEGVGEEKYDATSASMMALLKYGSGMPFHRLEGLQEKME